MGKVLIYTLTEGIGGVEEYIMNLSRYIEDPQSKFGYLIIGQKSIYESELKKMGIDYYYIPPKKSLYSNIKRYNELFNKLRDTYDTIYFNTSGLYYPVPYLFAKKYNYRIVLHSHLTSGPWPKSILHKANRKWINQITSLKLACSTPAGEWMFGKDEKFLFIPNAINLERFRYQKANREIVRKKLDVDNCFVVGNVARLNQIKNQSFLIDVIGEIYKENKNVRLILVGDGDLKEKLEIKSRELGLSDSIIFVGRSDEPELYYSAMDCYVMTSFIEGFPISLIEAQANGLPCVVADTITKETAINPNVSFLSLNDSLGVWCDTIQNTQRYDDNQDRLKNQKFDVSSLPIYIYNLIAGMEKEK